MPESFLWLVNSSGSAFILGTSNKNFKQLENTWDNSLLVMRLSSSNWCSWALGNNNRIYTYVLSSDVPIRVPETTFENQRWNPLGNTFSKHGLLRTDRYAWSDETGVISKPKEGVHLPSQYWDWESDWLIDENLRGEVIGREGWQYAVDFPREYFPEKHWNSFVRRRKWIRFRRFSSTNAWARISDLEDLEKKEKFIDISVGGYLLPSQPTGFLSVWALTHTGKVYARSKVHYFNPEGDSWQQIDSPEDKGLINISVGASNLLWAINWEGQALVRTEITINNTHGVRWKLVEFPDESTHFAQVSVGKNSVWALSRDGQVWFRKGTSGEDIFWNERSAMGTTWVKMVGQMSHISVSSNDQVFTIDTSYKTVYFRTCITRSDLTGKTWQPINLVEDFTSLIRQGLVCEGNVCYCGDPENVCSLHDNRHCRSSSTTSSSSTVSALKSEDIEKLYTNVCNGTVPPAWKSQQFVLDSICSNAMDSLANTDSIILGENENQGLMYQDQLVMETHPSIATNVLLNDVKNCISPMLDCKLSEVKYDKTQEMNNFISLELNNSSNLSHNATISIITPGSLNSGSVQNKDLCLPIYPVIETHIPDDKVTNKESICKENDRKLNRLIEQLTKSTALTPALCTTNILLSEPVESCETKGQTLTECSCLEKSDEIEKSLPCKLCADSTMNKDLNDLHSQDQIDYSFSISILSSDPSSYFYSDSFLMSTNLLQSVNNAEAMEPSACDTTHYSSNIMNKESTPAVNSNQKVLDHTLNVAEENQFSSFDSSGDEIINFASDLISSDTEHSDTKDNDTNIEATMTQSVLSSNQTEVPNSPLSQLNLITPLTNQNESDAATCPIFDKYSKKEKSLDVASEPTKEVNTMERITLAQPRLCWKWLDAKSCVIDDPATVDWLTKKEVEKSKRIAKISEYLRNTVMKKLLERNLREVLNFKNFDLAVNRTTWIKKASMYMNHYSKNNYWLPCNVEFEQGINSVTEGCLTVDYQYKNSQKHIQIPLSEMTCVKMTSDPHVTSCFLVYTSMTNLIYQPLLLKAASDKEAEEWIGCLCAANAKAWNMDSPISSGAIWSCTFSGDVFVVPSHVTGRKPFDLCWGHHGGHMALVETAPSGVTWGIGFDKMPYFYNKGFGGAVTYGSLTMSDNIQQINDSYHVCVYENQKSFLVFGWRHKGMFGGDFQWVTESGQRVTCKEDVKLPSSRWQWTSDWSIDFNIPGGVDTNGWQYSNHLDGPFHRYHQIGESYRRRRWVRNCKISLHGPWETAGSLGLIDISIQIDPVQTKTDPIVLWAVGANGDVLYRQGVTEDNPLGECWIHVATDLDKPFKSISIGGKYRVWGIASDGSAWYRSFVSPTHHAGNFWLQVVPPPPVSHLLRQVSAGATAVWAVDTGDNLWRRENITATFPEGTGWELVASRVKRVSVGPQDQVWIVTDSFFCKAKHGPGVIYNRVGITEDKPSGTDWEVAIGSGWAHVSIRGVSDAVQSCPVVSEESWN